MLKFPIWRGRPIKHLTMASCSSGGENGSGRIVSNYRGAGNTRRYRIVDFRRLLRSIPARIVRFERDPYRSAPLVLLCYSNGVLAYILATKHMYPNTTIQSGVYSSIYPGNALPLFHIPIGTFVHNVEPRRGLGGTLIRTAGGKSQILRKSGNFSVLRLPSRRATIYSFIVICYGWHYFNFPSLSINFA